MLYETLLAGTDGILDVRETELEYGLKGLYCDGRVWIDKDMTCTDKACILAEEIGHHCTSAGNILDQSVAANRQQEYRARAWGYRLLVSLESLIALSTKGITCRAELADALGVTEWFLCDALDYYKSRYGLYVRHGSRLIYFDPLRVEKRGD